MVSTLAATGFWSDTVGLVFTYGILLPGIATGLIVVAMVSGRGEKRTNDELRGRWGRRRGDTD
jgi:hypothetical protein